ncbi:MAG: SMP-30/gluconolactonase/LRE family protein [Oscillospiraceae bacterium]
MSKIRVFMDNKFSCAEGPLWEKELQRLLFVDSDRTFVYAASDTELVTMIDDMQVSSIAFAKSGYVLLGDGVCLLGRDGSKQRLLTEHDGEKLFFNDSIVGPDGRIYAGTYYWGEGGMIKTGKLYRLQNGHEPVVLDDGIELSNGLAFSPDHDLLYYSDSARKCIFCYDFDSVGGTIANKRIFVRSAEGIPDGITTDSEGFVWCAMWYEGAVYRFDPDGKVERKYMLPVKQVSSVAFGGKDMNVLYITSAATLFKSPMMPKGLDKKCEMGGKIYCIETDVVGRTEWVAEF